MFFYYFFIYTTRDFLQKFLRYRQATCDLNICFEMKLIKISLGYPWIEAVYIKAIIYIFAVFLVNFVFFNFFNKISDMRIKE